MRHRTEMLVLRTKKSNNKIVFKAEILNDGSAQLTARNEKDIIQQAGVDKLEIDIEDVL